MSDCEHKKLKCHSCMRDGSLEYFIREAGATAGYKYFADMEHVSDKEWDCLAEMVWDWVREVHPEEDLELDFQLNIWVQIPEDANDVEEEDLPEEACEVPEGLEPFIPVGNIHVRGSA